jgi:hypothetical protein
VSPALASGLVVVAAVAVFAATVAALVAPLLQRPTAPGPALAEGEADEAEGALLEERESALAALRELDFDYAVGKLAEEDYHAMRERYERRALALLKATDTLHDTPPRPAPAPAALPANGYVVDRAACDALAGRGADHPPVAHANGVAGRVPAAKQAPRAPATDHASRAPAAPSGPRARTVALSAAAVALVFVVGVAAVYVAGNRDQGAQRALATLEGIGPRALAIPPAEPHRAFLATAAGLWTSADAGASWQQAPGLDRALRAVAVSPARPTRVYAAAPDAVSVSDDGGRTWTTLPLSLPPGEGPGAAAPPLPQGDATGGATGGARADGATAGSQAPADLRALAVHPDDADRLWIAVEGAGIYRSDDAARTWARTSRQAPANATALVFLPDVSLTSSSSSQASGATRDSASLVEGGGSPQDRGAGGGAPGGLYLASATEGILASADEGRGWAPASGVLSGALPTRRVSSLVFDAASGDTATTPDGRILRGTLYAGTDQGVFRSIDRGLSWARLSLAASVAAVAAGGASGGSLLLAVDREGHVYRSQNRGVTWDGQ